MPVKRIVEEDITSVLKRKKAVVQLTDESKDIEVFAGM